MLSKGDTSKENGLLGREISMDPIQNRCIEDGGSQGTTSSKGEGGVTVHPDVFTYQKHNENKEQT